jgi:uncharacterized DUF497 family protein
MEFEWDADKHHKNFNERGLGFDFASKFLKAKHLFWRINVTIMARSG